MEIRPPFTEKEWSDYYDLRYRLLREPWNQPRGSERNEGDVTATHFALFDTQQISAVARLDKLNNELFQVRFVAVDSSKQKKGYGKLIMEEVEKAVVQQKGREIILHARENAVSFYLRLGYQIQSKSHVLFDEIHHYLMMKRVK
ncbi:MAG: GNAT family N-acetyltransferase [Crocinitomicaceae bacterium]|nr:GNAT family N-acetyltransferase [Crocinitomicaceae bacterium]